MLNSYFENGQEGVDRGDQIRPRLWMDPAVQGRSRCVGRRGIAPNLNTYCL
jgi:hypothetical protein